MFDKAVVVNQDTTTGGAGNYVEFAETLLHELIHGFTTMQLYNNFKFDGAVETLMEDAKQYIKDNPNSVDSSFETMVGQYGFTDTHEFLAEALLTRHSNRLLVVFHLSGRAKREIEQLGYEVGQNATLFDAFKAMVRQLMERVGAYFGVESGEISILDAVMDVTSQETLAKRNSERVGNNGVFFQMAEENLNEFEQKVEKAQKPAWTIAKGKEYGQSKITGKTKQTNLAEVIENFKKENGRAPRVLVWGGDQSGRGTYTTKNGTEINIEGGISFAEDQENKDNGVAWASNKGANDINSMMANADIVAIAAMSPETGHAFYKGSSTVYFTEIAEAMNNNAGKSIVWKDAPKNGKGEAITIEIPQEGFADPILAMRSLYEQLEEKVGKKQRPSGVPKSD